MARQALSQGSCRTAWSINMDLPELGNGAQTSSTTHEGGTTAEAGSKPRNKKEYHRNWYLKNRSRLISKANDYAKRNPNRTRLWRKAHYERNKLNLNARSVKWGRENQERVRWLSRERYKKEREALGFQVRKKRATGTVSNDQKRLENNEACKRYRHRHLERRRKSARDWGRRNMKSQVARRVIRYHTDLAYNIRIKLSRRIGMALRTEHFRIEKKGRTIDLLGCSYSELIERFKTMMPTGTSIEDLFTSKIHIDHIKPCVKFNLEELEEQKKCFHYTNLQPLIARDNIIKKDKYEEMALIKPS